MFEKFSSHFFPLLVNFKKRTSGEEKEKLKRDYFINRAKV